MEEWRSEDRELGESGVVREWASLARVAGAVRQQSGRAFQTQGLCRKRRWSGADGYSGTTRSPPPQRTSCIAGIHFFSFLTLSPHNK